jgi:hypothetical protein
MTKGWLIVVPKGPLGGDDEPEVDRYIVAVADQGKAEKLLRTRLKMSPEAKVLVFGEAPEMTMAWLNAKRGDIHTVAVVV